MEKRRLIKLLGILTTLLIIGLLVMSWLLRNQLESFLASKIQVYGFIIVFIISALLEFIPQAIAPEFILINAAVLKLPMLTSVVIVTLGSTFGAFTGFEVGRKYGFRFISEIYGNEKARKVSRSFSRKGKWFVALAALTPLPYLPMVFGSIGMTRKDFIFYGIIPRAISFFLLWFLIIRNISLPF